MTLLLIAFTILVGAALSSAFTVYSPKFLNTRRRISLDMKFCLSVKLSINPERRAEFLECIRKNAEGTLTKEPQCIGYTWGESTTQPNVFHFQEQFVDKNAFEIHTKMPHFLEWEKFASSPNAFTAPPILDFFEEI